MSNKIIFYLNYIIKKILLFLIGIVVSLITAYLIYFILTSNTDAFVNAFTIKK